MKKIIILGSTGSIGTQALDVVARHPDRFQVVGLVAGKNAGLVKEQVDKFRPKRVALAQDGEQAICDLVGELEADLVISAIVGAAGLKPTIRAIETGKSIALANKESMVIAGELITRLAQEHNVSIFPIDSEHSAIFQALAGNRRIDVKRIILTASGGPFFQRPAEQLSSVTVEEALKHPKWKMGEKITIDSATLMNKGLEVLEASWLFQMPVSQIDICIHPQSIIHSMVEYIDGSVIAQMGVPDMRCAISYAMAYPERVASGVASLDLLSAGPLSFYPPDRTKFPCVGLAYEAAKMGKTMPAVLNAANEIAVERFLKRKIGFTQIPAVIEKTMEKHTAYPLQLLEDVLEADCWAREEAAQ